MSYCIAPATAVQESGVAVATPVAPSAGATSSGAAAAEVARFRPTWTAFGPLVEVAETVIVAGPGVPAPVLPMVRTALPGGLTGFVSNPVVVPAGLPPAARVTGSA